jgi:hypothetical protein
LICKLRCSTLTLHFIVIKNSQVEQVKKTDPHAKVVWVNRLDVFKPNPELVARYQDFLRRYGGKHLAYQFAMEGSHFDANYRGSVTHNTKAMSKLRELATIAKTDPVYLVDESGLPNISILVDMATRMVGAGVW